MRIITWNCNMAFRKKAASILEQKPDILVVPECEHPDKLKFPSGIALPGDIRWFGTNRNKGLGIFSFGHYRLKLHKSYNEDFKLIVPLAVTGGAVDFILFAVWANNPGDKDGQYIAQVWKAVHQYDQLLKKKTVVLAGDFNSNTIWDKEHREGNHSALVQKLKEKKISSTYHLFHQQEQGREKDPTLYLYRHQNKPYHLDYCFVSEKLAEKLEAVEVGRFEDWCGLSDHVPLMVTFKL